MAKGFDGSTPGNRKALYLHKTSDLVLETSNLSNIERRNRHYLFFSFTPTFDTMKIKYASSLCTKYHHDVDVSVKGVLQTITDDITLVNTGVYLDATYGEGAKPISW